MPQREKYFENKIKRYLDSKGCWYVKFYANKYTSVGIPDVLACVNGKFFGIEVKNEIGKPSDLQLYHIDAIKQAGGEAMVVRPQNFEEFKKKVEMMLRD